SQGQLRPEYEGVELGVAVSLASRAVAEATGADADLVTARLRSLGDLGDVAQELLSAQGRTDADATLTTHEVYDRLLEVARTSGEGSQEAKIAQLRRLLGQASPVEGKYLLRFVVGTLRLGVREATILDAFASTYGDGAKETRLKVEAAFNVSSDLGVVAETLVHGGIEALSSIRLTVGRPVRPMLAERAKDLAEVLERMEGRAALEYKYDGLRVQAHIDAGGRVRLFSRRLEEIGPQFPELLEELPKTLHRTPAIIEGECVSIDLETDEIRPFQEISRRRGRKYDLEKMRAEIPVVLFVFDVLLDGSEETFSLPFPERRARLATLVAPSERIRLATQATVSDVEAAQAFFDQSIADGCEGVMAKSLSPDSAYRAGARGFWWVKYKREYTQGLADSIDGVIVGAFHGRGRRAGSFGAFLLAARDPETQTFESFCKVGTGFDDATLQALPARLAPLVTPERPPGVETGLVPDVWIRPSLVLEVRGAELSLSPTHRAGIGLVRPGAGFALRFPRFTGRFRDDKGPDEATTVTELLTLYRSQVRRESTGDDESPDGAGSVPVGRKD
ncbi:MAG: ATP-dependent DNA ligase, partial [Thermoplasmata archaeon]|nr:ATP-dependent DNA ligase [Thermoplasmata archaeon]